MLAEAFPDAIWHAETLVFNGHGIAKYLLSRAVRDAGIKVVFTGEGADEVLAGYPPFRRDLLVSGGADGDGLAERLAELDRANQSSRGLLVADGPAAPGLDILGRRLGFVPSWVEVQSTLATKLTPLFNESYRELGRNGEQYTEFLDSADPRGRLVDRDPVNQALYLWSASMLHNYILTVLGDRMEMAHSLEGRVPFLDHHVADYAARLPLQHKIRLEPDKPPREKHVLREAVRDFVLPEVYDRQKHPFMSPPARSDDDPLGVFCQDVLRSPVVEAQPFFDPKRVREFIDDVAALPPADRAASEGAVLKLVSTCVLHELFEMSA
jgi:asparagine synthase (glutamine-hydrolysing)